MNRCRKLRAVTARWVLGKGAGKHHENVGQRAVAWLGEKKALRR